MFGGAQSARNSEVPERGRAPLLASLSDAPLQLVGLLSKLRLSGTITGAKLRSVFWLRFGTSCAVHSMAGKPTANVASKNDNLNLGDVRAVGALLNPVQEKRLVLRTNGFTLHQALFQSRFWDHEEPKRCNAALHAKHYGITDVCKNKLAMLTRRTPRITKDKSTSALPRQGGARCCLI